MKIKFFQSHELDKTYKLSVHKSGKLGFTNDAATALKLTADKSASIGVNEEDENDPALYMVINDKVVPGSFKVSKAGHYYYLNIKLLLENLKIDYLGENVVFKMEKVKVGEDVYYKLFRIENEKPGTTYTLDDDEPEDDQSVDDLRDAHLGR